MSTRDRMLAATSTLVHARGYRGVSLSDVLAESGAPRGSLYHHFPGGKDQLVLEALLREVRRINDFLLEAFGRAESPAEGVRAYALGAAEELRASGYVLGCPVAPVVLDAPEPASELDRACRESFEAWHRILRDRLLASGVPPDRSESLALVVVSAVEGGILLAKSRRDTAPLESVAEEMSRLVADAAG